MKFKVGDKVRCIKPTLVCGVEVGGVYTVKGVNHRSEFGLHVNLVEVLSTPTQDVFELVQEGAVLTPEVIVLNGKKYREILD